MLVKALVELSDAIVSGRDSDHLRRFPGRFNLYKPVFQARGYRRGREPVFAQTARLIYRAQSQTTTSYRCHSLYLGSAVRSVRLANALTIVKPDTLIRWHRIGFRLFWKYKSRPRGRPRVPAQLQKLIVEMATSNPTWGEERIADELLLKIGIRISPRTVRRYMPKTPRPPADPKQRWMTFVRNHARAIIACDFFVVVTATFQPVYVFLIMEIHTRRLLHFNVTRHPTADWTRPCPEVRCGDRGEIQQVCAQCQPLVTCVGGVQSPWN